MPRLPRATITALILLGALCPALSAQKDEPALRAMDSAWARSYATHDTALAISLMSDRMVMTSTDGQVKDKVMELEHIRPAPGLVMHHFRTSEVRVDLYQGVAIVTGLADWAFTFNGKENAVQRRYTAVYVPGGKLGWQLVALHMGRAPEPTPPS
jgi:ketosteroid isomerase-like protein